MNCTASCGECGSNNIQLKNAKGRKFGYMQWDEVELKVDVELFTCMDCSNILLGPGDAVKLDDAFKASLQISKPEVKTSPIRFQVVKYGPGYRVRYRSFGFWRWLTEVARKGREKISFFPNLDSAMTAAQEFVEFKMSMKEKKSKEMEIVYDSEKGNAN